MYLVFQIRNVFLKMLIDATVKMFLGGMFHSFLIDQVLVSLVSKTKNSFANYERGTSLFEIDFMKLDPAKLKNSPIQYW